MMYDGFRPSKARQKNREAGVFKVSSLGIVNVSTDMKAVQRVVTHAQVR